jgi:hypothetical protein
MTRCGAGARKAHETREIAGRVHGDVSRGPELLSARTQLS